MSSSLADIPTADERRAAAQRAAESAAQRAADAPSQFEKHWARAIAAWCSQPTQDGHELIITGVNILDDSVVSSWVAELTAKGYKATLDESKNRLSVSA